MAYLAAFAYDTRIEAKGVLQVPQELSAFGFDKLTSFHNGMTDGWAYIAEGTDLIVLAFRGTSSTRNWDTDFQVALVHPENTDRQQPIQRSACFTGINFSLWRSCCSAAPGGLVQSLENESPLRKTPAIDPEFAVARRGCTATQ